MTHANMAANDAARQDITPYQFEGHTFSIVDVEGEPWFVAAEAARELGYHNTNDLTRALDADEKGTHTARTPGGEQSISIVSEPGLYRAIVTRRANRNHDASLTARLSRFQRWVFHDVLPSIRRTGAYGAVAHDAMAVLNDPASMRGLLLSYSEKVLALEGRVGELAPKAEQLDRIADAHGSHTRTEAAKILGVAPHALCRWLKSNDWIYKRASDSAELGFQSKINAGLLEHRITTGTSPEGYEWSRTQVRITPRGVTVLAKAFPRAATEA